ncbi:hypothetical protein P153DRAFT_425802 [Dothidotthia symphoricarpi CBS 119687]|uniref:Uncharacterized protein n=1 Tax=Dothidotthia symphoricarpi CBS 119687 TaxID=1392245 RepID=A0A6A6A048_9PLEO|nr:uncharacterized protein P153DRAFT_425802 [Dothidotthia symphoricarpi CBS 119687]KAF2125382.1 hypothetical protein P153DRAFT_425802 [Dothidotthia symphoricarpi CBS 119687]
MLTVPPKCWPLSTSNEILFNVVAHLVTGDDIDVKTLLNLCRSSRVLLDIAQPALYTCVRITEPAVDPLKPLKIFLRTLMERPSLSKETQELALINDRHLHFTAQIEAPCTLLERVHELQADSSIFSKLKTFHLHKKYEQGPVNIKEYIHLMRYPSFKRFSTENDVPHIIGEPRAINTLTQSAVELLWCIAPLPTMRQLLDVCPRLTLFEFVVPDRARYTSMLDVGHEPLVGPQELVEALLKTHSHTLKSLRLDFHHFYDISDPDMLEELEQLGETPEDCWMTYSSMRGFENLTHMTIEFQKLVKVHKLPASLESLNLELCEFADLNKEFLDDLIQLKEKWCPVIESVTVSGLEKTNEDGRTLTFLGVGYQLRIQSYQLLITG